MILCEIQNNGPVLIYCLNNSTRGNFIISSQEEAIPNLEILDQVGREGRVWLSGTILEYPSTRACAATLATVLMVA